MASQGLDLEASSSSTANAEEKSGFADATRQTRGPGVGVSRVIEIGTPLAIAFAFAIAGSWYGRGHRFSGWSGARMEGLVQTVESSGKHDGESYPLPFQSNRRVRLGDTIYAGRAGGIAYFYSAVRDDRLLFGAPEPSPTRPEQKSDLTAPPSVETAGGDAPRLWLVGEPPPAPLPESIRAAQMSPPSKLEIAPPHNLQATEQQAAPSGTETTNEILTAAAMTALLQADGQGVGTLRFLALPSDQAKIIALLPRLQSVWDFSIPKINVRTSRTEWLWNRIATPLPFPNQKWLVNAQAVDYKIPPPDPKAIINPVYRVQPQSTRMPAIAFVLFGFLGLVGILRNRGDARTGVSSRGFIDGIALTAGLIIAMAILFRFWWWFPDSWFATAPGLTVIALAVGGLEGGLLSWLHPAPELVVKPEADSALRSALYRDTPIADIAQDRLGFAPLIDALRRFLDNPGTAPPVVLSVNGPWGSGKSSVMKMLDTELKKTHRFHNVWFNAWQYHREKEILSAFLRTIGRELSQGLGPVFSVKLGWARWIEASLGRQLIVVCLVAAAIIGILHPDLRDAMIKALSGESGPLAQLFSGSVSLGIAGWTIKLLQPFSESFITIFAPRDKDRRGSSIDEFAREFRLFRRALGRDQKLLFMIDDLDRCQPDRVVDLLKTINLIIASVDQGDRSFFVLGYDQRYIVEAVEQHFKDLAKAPVQQGERFGFQYLKKMVTLSVSVPMPSAERVQELLERVDCANEEKMPEAEPEALTRWQQLKSSSTQYVRKSWDIVENRMVQRQAAFVLLLAGIVLLLAQPGTSPNLKGSQVSGIQTSASTSTPDTSGVFTINFEDPDLPTARFTSPFYWAFPISLLILAGAALYEANRIDPPEARYRREPRDSERFVQAIRQCKPLLPQNPRDAIRLVNLMRMEYLIQRQAELPGGPLDEWECASLMMLERRHPIFFLPQCVDGKIIPGLNGSTGEPAQFYRGIQIGDVTGAGLASDIEQLQQAGASVAHLMNPDKLHRFVDVNRFLLEASV